MFIKCSQDIVDINKTWAVPVSLGQHTTRHITYKHINDPINPCFVFKLKKNTKFFITETNECPIFSIKFISKEGKTLYPWEYENEEQRDSDFEKLLTQL